MPDDYNALFGQIQVTCPPLKPKLELAVLKEHQMGSKELNHSEGNQ